MSNYRKTFASTDPDEYDNCPDFLARYIQYLQICEAQKNSSVQDYLLCLREFCQFVLFSQVQPDAQPVKDLKLLKIYDLELHTVAAVTRDQVERYLHFAESVLNNSGGTVKKKVAYLRMFFSYLEKNSDELGIDLPRGNPVRIDFKGSQTSSSSTTVLNTSEVQQLLQGVPSGENEARDKAMILLLVTTSLSISELVSLNRTDVCLHSTSGEKPCITVYRNGRKAVLPLSAPCIKALKRYIDATDPLLPVYQKALFLSSQKLERMTERGIQKRIKLAAAHAGLRKDVSAQVLRNTAVYNFLNATPSGAESLLLNELGFNTDYTFRRVTAGGLLAQAAADSPLNKLEV